MTPSGRAEGRLIATLMAVLTIAATCDYVGDRNFGLTARGGRPTAVVYACGAGHSMHITLIRNPDRFADTGDEETLWEVRGEAPARGILRIPIGGVIPDFVEEVPLVGALVEDLAYEIAFTSDDGSAGLRFTPSELPQQRIEYADTLFTEQEFVESARGVCRG
jgi:hypothetical protein